AAPRAPRRRPAASSCAHPSRAAPLPGRDSGSRRAGPSARRTTTTCRSCGDAWAEGREVGLPLLAERAHAFVGLVRADEESGAGERELPDAGQVLRVDVERLLEEAKGGRREREDLIRPAPQLGTKLGGRHDLVHEHTTL